MFRFFDEIAEHARELYQEIQGLKSPWRVSEVSVDVCRQQVDMYFEDPVELNKGNILLVRSIGMSLIE